MAVVSRERGHTVISVIVALAVLTVLATASYLGGRGQLAHAARSFDKLEATRKAAGRLEALEEVEAGESLFPGGRQVVREIEPGLFEVQVTVDGVVLTTLVRR